MKHMLSAMTILFLAATVHAADEEVLVKFLSSRELTSGTKTQLVATFAALVGGAQVTALVPPTNAEMTTLIKAAKPGDTFSAKFTKAADLTLSSLKTYKAPVGEDEPGVFVFVKAIDEVVSGKKRSGAMVTKLGQKATVYAPMRKDEKGNEVPEELVTAQLRSFKQGKLIMLEVEQQSGMIIVKSAALYEPPKTGTFSKKIEEKAEKDQDAWVGMELTDGTKLWALMKAGVGSSLKPDANILTIVNGLKPNQKIDYRTKQEEKGLVLTYIKPGPPPEEPKPAPK